MELQYPCCYNGILSNYSYTSGLGSSTVLVLGTCPMAIYDTDYIFMST